MVNTPLNEEHLPLELDDSGPAHEPFGSLQGNPVIQEYFELETTPPDPSDSPSTDPEVIERRTNEIDYALDKETPGRDVIASQLSNGDEPYLRDALAASTALKDRQKRLQLVKEAAGAIDRPLTVEEADGIMSMVGDTNRDPKVILEELYGERIASNVPNMLQKALNKGPEVAEEYVDQAGAVAKHTARSKIARAVLEDTEAQWKAAGIWDTGLSYAKQFVPFWSYSNLTTAVDKAPTGFSLAFGRTIEEEIEYLYTLRPSQFKEELTAAVRKIAEDSPLDAYLFANGVVNYAPTDQALDNLFGAMDMTAFLPLGKTRLAKTVGKTPTPPVNPAKDLGEALQAKSSAETVAKTPQPPESPIQPVGQYPTSLPVDLYDKGGIKVTWDKAKSEFSFVTNKKGESSAIVQTQKGSPTPKASREDILRRYEGANKEYLRGMPEEFYDNPERVDTYVRDKAVVYNDEIKNRLSHYIDSEIDIRMGSYDVDYDLWLSPKKKDLLATLPRGIAAKLGNEIQRRISVGLQKGQTLRELLDDHFVALRKVFEEITDVDRSKMTKAEILKVAEEKLTVGNLVSKYKKGAKHDATNGFEYRQFIDLIEDTRRQPRVPQMALEREGFGPTRFTVKLDKEELARRATTKIESGAYKKLFEGKNGFFEYFKALGGSKSMMTFPPAEKVYESVRKLLTQREIAPEERARVEAFLDESFDPWPDFKFKKGVAQADLSYKSTVPGLPSGHGLVSVDPNRIKTIVGPKIGYGQALYEGAERLPAWLSGDANALFELILWHETAHVAIGPGFASGVVANENLVNALALTKLYQYRNPKPGVGAKRTITQDAVTPEPIPYTVRQGVKPNEPKEPAVVFTSEPRGSGKPFTAYDPLTRTVTINRPAIEAQWGRKPWRNPKIKGVKSFGTDADFATPEDWVNFTVAKQKLKASVKKPAGRRFADHENYLNTVALQTIRVQKSTDAAVAKNLVKGMSRSGGETPGVRQMAQQGRIDDAATEGVKKRLSTWFGKDPLDDSQSLRERTVSLFDPSRLADGSDSIPRPRIDRIMRNLTNNAERLLGIPLNNAAIVRLPEEALKVAIDAAKANLARTYDRVNDAFLDISLGGPFAVTRPEEQLVNTTVVHLKMGRPDGLLFDNPAQAAFYGTEQYGLSPSQFTILQQGQGFYINIAKNVDETLDSVRDAIVQTNNQSQKGFLNTFLSFFRTSDDLLGDLANQNRMLATTAAQELHRILIDSSQAISKNLTKREREQLDTLWQKNRDLEYDALDDAGNTVTKRGFYYNTLGEFESAYFDRFRELPSEAQTEAYFTYVQLNDMDYVLRNLALHRDFGRMGAEKVRVFYDALDEAGNPATRSSRAFAGRITDKLPLEDQSEDFGIWFYDPAKKKGEFLLRSQVTTEVRGELDKALNERGFKVVEVVNPLEKPLLDVAGTTDTINFLVVKNFDNSKFDWGILPRQPGGHVEYGDQFFVKQPRIRRTTSSGVLRHIYEGDVSLLNAATQAEAEKFAKAAETGRQLLKAGKEAELKTYLYQNTPWDIETFKSFFASKEVAPGVFKPSLLHMDDPITWTFTGRNTSDMDHFKGTFNAYGNFFNGVRSKYNLFAQGVDKKYLGSRDPDLPRVEELGTESSPIYRLAKPRLLSPLDTLNKALANVSRSRHMNDYKTHAVESFVEEFKDVMKTPQEELRRNPVYYFHNPVWDTETTNKSLLAAGQAAHRAHTYFIGTESELGSKMFWLQSKVANEIYKKLGQKASNHVTEKYIPTLKDPFTYARSIAFHSKLGLFNPVQLFLQAQSWVHIAAIAGPTEALRSAGDAIRMRQLRLTEDSKIIDQFARWSGRPALFKESYQEMMKTGYYNVGGEVAWRDDVFDPNLFKGKVGTFLEKGTFFFDEGERFVRMSAWNAAFYGWREANPGKAIDNAARNQILKRADLMAVNMTRASNASWQQGLLSVPTQFLSFQARLAEQMLPGFSTRLTPKEKLRAFLTYSAIYGIPVGAGAATAVWPYHEDIRQAALERGINLDNRMLQIFNEGLVDTMFSSITGKEYNLSERYGPKGTTLFKEVLNGDMSVTELLLGASGSIIGDMISSAEPATNALLTLFNVDVDPPTMDDFLEVTRNISTINNGMKAWYMYNQGRYFTRNGSVVMDNATGFDAFMQGVFGTTPEAATDTFVMIKSRKEQREAEQAAEKEIYKWYRKAIREYNEGNEDLGNTYLKRAKAWLVSSGINPSKYGSILNNAIKGNETLFNSVREDFWRKAPATQVEPRRQMMQGE